MKTSGYNENDDWRKSAGRARLIPEKVVNFTPNRSAVYEREMDLYRDLATSECWDAVTFFTVALVCTALLKITAALNYEIACIALLAVLLLALGSSFKSLRNWIKFRRKAS